LQFLAELPKQRERLVEKFVLDLNPPDQIFWQLSIYWTFKDDVNILVVFSGAGRVCGFILIGRENIELNART